MKPTSEQVCGWFAEWVFSGQSVAPDDHIAQRAAAWALEEAAKICDAYSDDRWAAYKGRTPYEPMNPDRATDYAQGESGGANHCAEAIRKEIEK